MNNLIVDHAKKIQKLGFRPVPIAAGREKKPPSWFSWTDLRDRKGILTDDEIENIFSKADVARIAIILNTRCLLIDYDGALGEHMLWNEMISRCSKKLVKQLRSTTHTKTPHGGHVLIMLDSNAFPEGIEEILCWQLLANGHGSGGNAEIRILSQNKYSIEYGEDYEPIVDIQKVVTLSKEESIELVEICRHFKLESTGIRNIARGLLAYWVRGRRQSLTFALSGYLYKNKVAIDVTRHLVQHLVQITNDEEADTRFDAVNRTYAKDVEEVSGLSMLIELIDGNESIIQMMKQQLSKVGYSSHDANGNGDARTRTRRNTSGDQNRDNEEKKLSAVVIELLEPCIKLLFKNKIDDKAFAAIHINGHREIISVYKSKRFDLWVRKSYYDETGDTLSSDVLKEVVDTLQAKALFDGPEKTLDLRISKDPQDDIVYWYDLCNENWEAIRITRDGWNIVKSGEVPIMFRRYSSQQAQVYPSKNYPPDIMDQFLELINLKEGENSRLLVKCYIVSILVPGIAKAILMIHGPKGAAKTAFEDLVKQFWILAFWVT